MLSLAAPSSGQWGTFTVSRTRVVERYVLEERVVSGRGQIQPRGVKRKMSNDPVRARGPRSRTVQQWTPSIGSN